MSRFEKGHQKINKTAKKGSKVEKKIIAFFWDTLEFLTGWTKFHVEALCTLLSSGLAILLPACGNNDAGEGQNCEMIINDHIIFSNYLLRARPHHHIDATHLLAWLCAGRLGLLREDPAPPCLSSDLPTDMEKSEILAPTTFCLRKIAPKKRLKTPLI